MHLALRLLCHHGLAQVGGEVEIAARARPSGRSGGKGEAVIPRGGRLIQVGLVDVTLIGKYPLGVWSHEAIGSLGAEEMSATNAPATGTA